MTAHSSILAWRIPWTEEPGGLQSIGLQRAGHNSLCPAILAHAHGKLSSGMLHGEVKKEIRALCKHYHSTMITSKEGNSLFLTSVNIPSGFNFWGLFY